MAQGSCARTRRSAPPLCRYPEDMSSRAPSYPQIARAQWLLGLDAPESADEIRRAWKERVARTHPDRNAERAGAATRVTAAFNQARELLRVVARGGRAVAEAHGARGAARARAGARRAPARAHAGAEPLVLPCRRPRDARRAGARSRLRAGAHRAGDGGPGRTTRVELDDGSSAAPADLVPVAYGCPVCGHCSGPAVERPALRPCPACLAELVQLERSDRAVEPALRGASARAPAPAARPLPRSATTASRSSRASAIAGPRASGGGRARSAAARCSRPTRTPTRSGLRARPRATAPASTRSSCRSRRAASRRSRGSR